MRYYPVFLDLRGRKCLVVGKGRLAEEKASALRKTGAVVVRTARFREEDAGDCSLIVAWSQDPPEMDRMRDFADRRHIPLNVIDQPSHCSFIAPAIVERGDLTIAISTSGHCPALAARIRQELEECYGPEFGELVALLGEIRLSVKQKLTSYDERRAFYHEILDLDLVQALKNEGPDRVKALVNQALENH